MRQIQTQPGANKQTERRSHLREGKVYKKHHAHTTAEKLKRGDTGKRGRVPCRGRTRHCCGKDVRVLVRPQPRMLNPVREKSTHTMAEKRGV